MVANKTKTTTNHSAKPGKAAKATAKPEATTTTTTTVVVKKRRNKTGTKAVREIKRLQNQTDYLIPRLAFKRLVREVAQDLAGPEFRFQKEAYEALQEAAESYAIELFQGGNMGAKFANRTTVYATDIKFAQDMANVMRSGQGAAAAGVGTVGAL